MHNVAIPNDLNLGEAFRVAVCGFHYDLIRTACSPRAHLVAVDLEGQFEVLVERRVETLGAQGIVDRLAVIGTGYDGQPVIALPQVPS